MFDNPMRGMSGVSLAASLFERKPQSLGSGLRPPDAGELLVCWNRDGQRRWPQPFDTGHCDGTSLSGALLPNQEIDGRDNAAERSCGEK
jgi:hypothetical protein